MIDKENISHSRIMHMLSALELELEINNTNSNNNNWLKKLVEELKESIELREEQQSEQRNNALNILRRMR